MRTRFKAHKHLAAFCPLTGGRESVNFRMRLPRPLMPALADNLVTPDDDATHSGVRLRRIKALFCKINCSGDKTMISV
jgi:hypothetical protein